MKYFNLLTIIFIAIPTCKAMEMSIVTPIYKAIENINKTKILAELTTPKAPRFARYLTNDHVVIAGQKGCSILDLITKKEIKINHSECGCLEINRNEKTIIPYIPSKYNSNQFFSYQAKIYDAQNINSIKKIGTASYGGPCPHDLSNQFILEDYPSIAAIYKKMDWQYKIGKVIFCPNRQFLAILVNYSAALTNNSLIYYWDTITQNCVHISLLWDKDMQLQLLYDNNRFVKGIDLSFSPNEMELLITLDNHKNRNFVIISVPFIVRKKTPFIYWCLNTYELNQQEQCFNTQKLPQELINLIITTLLDI